MKNLEDYLPAKPRKKTPVKLSESPIYSPETVNALENAEKLIKEAQKKILEASYDVHSSPEREKSIGSVGNGIGDDDDALYIRDIVATRFHEANESGRIFTRPAARRPIEQFSKPEMRPRRARRIGERSDKTCSKNSTISRLLEMQNEMTKSYLNEPRGMDRNSTLPERRKFLEEIQMQISRENQTSTSKHHEKCQSPRKKDDRTSFQVQKGPHVDIRNELTITNIEKVDISPRPRSSLPVQQNIKTFEFRHESQVDKIPEREKQKPEICKVTLDYPEVEKISIEQGEKSYSADVTSSPRAGSQPDLVENKSDRSIQPESLEGHANTRISNRDEHVMNEKRNYRGESFIDFLRRAGNDENNVRDENCRNNLIFDTLETRDKINIFDRAVEQFLDEFRACEGERDINREKPEKDCVDGKFVRNGAGVEKLENLQENEFFDDINYSEENWDPEEINLEPPNFGELDNALKKFDGTINEVVRGTKSLGIVISEYSFKERVLSRSKSDPKNRDATWIDQEFYAVPTRDISSDLESENIEANVNREKKNLTHNADCGIKNSMEMEKSASSDGIFDGFSRLSSCESSKNGMPLTKVPRKFESHPRFSTPLNNVLKIGDSRNKNAVSNLSEFANFLDGIQRPKINLEPPQKNQDVSKIEKLNDDNITRKKLVPALQQTTKIDKEREKKIVLYEIEKRCNLNSLFNRERSSQTGNDETRETVTFPTYSDHEKQESIELRNSRTRSLIQDSAIGRETEEIERISTEMKMIDEDVAKKDSSKSERCESVKISENSQLQSMQSKNPEVTRTKTVIMKTNSIQHESEKNELGEKSSPLLQPETAIRTNIISKEQSKKNDSTKEDGVKATNLASNSPGSSLRDRTSFDISTVYSDDFENPTGSNDKTDASNKTNSEKNIPVKLSVNQLELPAKDESRSSKNNEDKNERTTSSQSSKAATIHSKSKVEMDYLEKSISISVINSVERKDDDKKLNDDNSRLDQEIIEENTAGEKNLEKEERDVPETLKKSSKDSNSAGSSIKSLKLSETSSLAEESRPERLKQPENSVLATNLTACSYLPCDDVIGPCNCKKCTICIVPKDVLEETTDHIESVFGDSLKNSEKQFIQLCISEEKIKTLESTNLVKIMKTKDSNVDEKLSEPEVEFREKNLSQKKECLKPEVQEPEVQLREKKVSEKKEFSKPEMTKFSISSHSERPGNEMIKSYGSSALKFDEIVHFESSLMIHSTPKKFIEDSTYACKKFDIPVPDPIPTDDHASRATDTCSENYSEGELYLPSSCSYSLGEIKISELGTCATSGPCVDSSSRNADSVRIFFTKSFANLDSSDNTADALNSPVQSLGEVQETDIESTGSSQRITSDGEHRGKL